MVLVMFGLFLCSLWEVIPSPEDPVRLAQYKELLSDILLDANNVRGMYDLSTKVWIVLRSCR